MNLCKDCRFFHESYIARPACLRKQKLAYEKRLAAWSPQTAEPDYVYGKPPQPPMEAYSLETSAQDVRHDWQQCGPLGKWFEPL